MTCGLVWKVAGVGVVEMLPVNFALGGLAAFVAWGRFKQG